ncbi:MAG TPA: hypothetical protein VGC65_03125 [Bacteroidia bacterium]|jgi:hypothetical protein
MKKLLLATCITIVLASCQKEDAFLPQSLPVKERIAELIHKADANLYADVYASNPSLKAPKPSVRYCPGIFVILQGDPASGTCFSSQNVCFVIVTAALPQPGGGNHDGDNLGGNPISELSTNINEQYGDDINARLVINTQPIEMKEVSSLSLNFVENGTALMRYKQK